MGGNQGELSKRTVLITGATQGIGKEIALRFASEGYQVAISCRSEVKYEQGKNVIEECKALSGEDGACIIADSSTSAGCSQLVEQTIEKFGKIDVLVNNAGVSKMALLHKMKEEDYRSVIANNQDSVFFMMQFAVKQMLKEKKGCIVNVASMAGIKGSATLIAYAASKSAVISMTKTAAVELLHRGIRVNAVAPGMVDTPMTQMYTHQQVENKCESLLYHRFATAKEIANAVYWLASDEASYVTGHVLTLSGGNE